MGSIEIKDLTKRYADHLAVDCLNLTVEDGQFVTLLGPSGCGKTTTLRMLAGFITPDEGTISVDGEVLSSPAGVVPPEKRGMGMVFQSYALWPHKSVFQNIAFGLRRQRPRPSKEEVQQRVSGILEAVNLADYGERFPGELSGGQQQRVALARSLVTEPSILLLDEPLSNLDAKLRDRMREEVLEIQRRTGITFVYVTHDQDEAMSMSDNVAVLRSGRLEQYAGPRDVYFRPATVAVADFMGQINLVRASVESTDHADGWVVQLDCGLRLVVTGVAFDAAPGDPVTAAIRPESLRLGPEAGQDGVVGEVVQATMLGNLCYYTVRIGDTELRVQTANTVELDRGDTVLVGADPLHVGLFPDGTTASSRRETEVVA